MVIPNYKFQDELDNVVEEEDGEWIYLLGGNSSSGIKKYRGSNSSDGGNTRDGVKIAGEVIGSGGEIGLDVSNQALSLAHSSKKPRGMEIAQGKESFCIGITHITSTMVSHQRIASLAIRVTTI
ncbi:hypothetical protein Tco_0714290 [Tanacetum coccineum]